MTKAITPVSVWYKGSFQNAVAIMAQAIHDDLQTSAFYYYELQNNSAETLASGNLQMLGTDYLARTNNDSVWQWIAAQLTLTLV